MLILFVVHLKELYLDNNEIVVVNDRILNFYRLGAPIPFFPFHNLSKYVLFISILFESFFLDPTISKEVILAFLPPFPLFPCILNPFF